LVAKQERQPLLSTNRVEFAAGRVGSKGRRLREQRHGGHCAEQRDKDDCEQDE
jgi:hypothetical protein